MDAADDDQSKQQITAEADKGLLADRHQPGISRKQVPQAGQRDEGEDLGKQPQRLPIAPERRQRQRYQRDGDQDDADAARTGGVLDPGHPDTLGNRPCGRTAKIARNTMWPASSCQPGSICAPTACDTPRMMPPASVPHMLPSPPMITASKPKISRAGPIEGSKLVRTARNTPAMAMSASATSVMAIRATPMRLERVECSTLVIPTPWETGLADAPPKSPGTRCGRQAVASPG